MKIAGVRVDQVTFAEAEEQIKQALADNCVHHVVTVNPEMVVAAQKDKVFAQVIADADLVVPDGAGLLAAAKVVESAKRFIVIRAVSMVFWLTNLVFKFRPFTVLPERVSGVDLVNRLMPSLAQANRPIFLLGGRWGEAQAAASRLRLQYPGLLVESFTGPANVQQETPEQFAEILSHLRQQPYRLVLVAFGHPKQELWIAKHKAALPPAVYIGVGGTFAFISGSKKRAHPLLQKLGLEWLWRLILEPKRWRRIMTAVVIFPWLVIVSP